MILNYGDLLEERILPHSDTAMYSLTRFLPAYPSLCLYLSVLSNCLSVRLSVCLSVHLSACPGCLHVGFLSSELTIFFLVLPNVAIALEEHL